MQLGEDQSCLRDPGIRIAAKRRKRLKKKKTNRRSSCGDGIMAPGRNLYSSSIWESMEDIRRYARDSPERAVLYPGDDAFGLIPDREVTHFDVLEILSSGIGSEQGVPRSGRGLEH